MPLQEQTPGSSEVTNRDLKDGDQQVVDSIMNAILPRPSTANIHKVPQMVRDTATDEYYNKYYVPKVVSIGPYHHGNPKLELVEKLKPGFTMKLLSKKEGTLTSLYIKLREMVHELKGFYEEDSGATSFCDEDFTRMMLLDSCFILYYIQYLGKPDEWGELKGHRIGFMHEDLFLLENQIPLKAVREVMEVVIIYNFNDIIYYNALTFRTPNRKWSRTEDQKFQEDWHTSSDHLLHLLHRHLTKSVNDPLRDMGLKNDFIRTTFHNVKELVDVGIHFKASNTMSLARIEIHKSMWWCTADVKLPPITVDDSTKPMLLNLIAYEMCSQDAQDAGVTSYICFLDSLIDHPEDVKTLRKAMVLEKSKGTDKEIAKLFSELSANLVPNNLAYLEAKLSIQNHYDTRSKVMGPIFQLKHEYFRSPWALYSLLGALLALLLSGVQAYFTVWSPKTECDGLCKMLKMNHHL